MFIRIFTLMLFCIGLSAGAANASDKKPNFLVIMGDDVDDSTMVNGRLQLIF